MDILSIRKYIGVSFCDYGESNDVIPKKWITKWKKNVKKCKWPHSNAQMIAKANQAPEEDWKTYKIDVLCSSNTYDNCLKKMYSIGSSGAETEETDTLAFSEGTSSFTPNYNAAPIPFNSATTIPEMTLNNCERCLNQDAAMKELLNEIKMVHKKLDFIKVKLDEKQYSGLPEPADTTEELGEIFQHDAFLPTIMNIIGTKPSETARRIIRRLMTKDLAVKFSFSGLGTKRQKIKLALQDYPQCNEIIDCIIQHHGIEREKAKDFIRATFKGASDWEGGRKLRLKPKPTAVSPATTSHQDEE